MTGPAEITDACIEWTGTIGTGGYGLVARKQYGKQYKAHRVAYCEHHGITLDAIKGWHVLHACDNPPCVNPNHLSLGTDKDNSDDKLRKCRQARGESSGQAVLTEAIVREIRDVFIPHSRKFGARALARKYGVSHQEVSDVANRKRWGHIV